MEKSPRRYSSEGIFYVLKKIMEKAFHGVIRVDTTDFSAVKFHYVNPC